MNTLLSRARFGAIAAFSGIAVSATIQPAQANPTSQPFSISGDVASLCNITNVSNGTMRYDQNNHKLTTEGNTRAGFTVSCNEGVSQITYQVAVNQSPTAAAETVCSLGVVGRGAPPGTLRMINDCAGTGSFTNNFGDVDGRTNVPPLVSASEHGEIVFEVRRDTGALDAGTHTYGVTLTWVP